MDGLRVVLAEQGLLVLFALALIEGPLVVLGATALAQMGVIDLRGVWLVAVLADVAGDLLLYGIGRFLPSRGRAIYSTGIWCGWPPRPEQAALVAAGQGDFDARVEMVEELGAARLCHLLFEDIPVAVLTEGRPSFAKGAPVGIRIGQEHLHCFDAVSGARIAPAMAGERADRSEAVV